MNGNDPTASFRSDFLLSIFPEPPQIRQFMGNLRNGRQPSLASTQTLPRISVNIREQKFPTSTRDSNNIAILGFSGRTESAGTQYDVTSFIVGGAPLLHGAFTASLKLSIIDLTSLDQSPAQIAAQFRTSDTKLEPSSAVLATIVTVERKSPNAIISRPQRVVRTSLILDDTNPTTSAGL
ncbi:hypothetical protein B0F90DRAFT_64021 [Multifurca ochricompacta]|uniref:Uncharacterized protein n=1 Tax=Multifurca ochricompacta TaxID=376703 RepID=A0AAD4QTI5_9AGAM|nr:hypothetical protein B0F90DRAFT_64021 [Multifurca ochricompacta]